MSEEKKAAQAAEEKQTVQAEETANVPETEAAEDTAPEVVFLLLSHYNM